MLMEIFCKYYFSGDLYLMFSPLQDDSGSTLTMTDVSVSDSGNIFFPPPHFPKTPNTVVLLKGFIKWVDRWLNNFFGGSGSGKPFSEFWRKLLSVNLVSEHIIGSL